MKTKLHFHLAALVAVLAISTTVFADDANKTNTKAVAAKNDAAKQPDTSKRQDAAAILKGIAALTEPSVLLNHVADIPPATGGTETVFVWKNTRYTLWIWDWTGRDGTEKPVTWARIYYRPVSSKGSEQLSIIGDLGLKGMAADGIDGYAAQKNGTALPPMFNGLDGKDKSFALDWDEKATPTEKVELQAKWDKRYSDVLTQLAEFLDHAKKYTGKTAAK